LPSSLDPDPEYGSGTEPGLNPDQSLENPDLTVDPPGHFVFRLDEGYTIDDATLPWLLGTFTKFGIMVRDYPVYTFKYSNDIVYVLYKSPIGLAVILLPVFANVDEVTNLYNNGSLTSMLDEATESNYFYRYRSGIGWGKGDDYHWDAYDTTTWLKIDAVY
jgi:hypothetical protein